MKATSAGVSPAAMTGGAILEGNFAAQLVENLPEAHRS
jgi:hypothetical protein